MRIEIIDAAERDIEDGYNFYERQSPGLGFYFLDSIYSDIDSLIYFGGIHIEIYGYHRLLSKRFPFSVYYKIDEDIVKIFAVLDNRRNPSWIRKRLTTN
ncbi:type II toxin-antitoxin system RelE/ParE family toxin [candidate division KSB1 bacterium]|nr:type II toxin-antitoxin system RelE/ParE family toxin [candidate division KSB1 bacterium]MBL7094020.1 type II toxin-antitoxin system RelE/ParE family toxin [candidate division KSB1 bacterium]